MPSPSASNAALLAVLLALAGCARPAPELPRTPPADGAAAAGADCAAIDLRLAMQAEEMDRLEGHIAANRESNQAIGYFSAVLFPPLALAAEANSSEKAALNARQQERDRALAERAAAGCPAPAVDPATGRLGRK